jgi:hypothetical protein
MTQEEIDMMMAYIRHRIVAQRNRDYLRTIGIRVPLPSSTIRDRNFTYPTATSAALTIFHFSKATEKP